MLSLENIVTWQCNPPEKHGFCWRIWHVFFLNLEELETLEFLFTSFFLVYFSNIENFEDIGSGAYFHDMFTNMDYVLK